MGLRSDAVELSHDDEGGRTNIADEVDGESKQVLIARKMKVIDQAFQFGVSHYLQPSAHINISLNFTKTSTSPIPLPSPSPPDILLSLVLDSENQKYQDKNIPLLLSKKLNRYKSVKGGNSFQSNFLTNAFSLMPVGFVNASSEESDGVPLSVWPFSIVGSRP